MKKPSHRQAVIGGAILVVLLVLVGGFVLWANRESLPPVDEMRGRLLAFLETIPEPLYFLAFLILPALGVPLTLFYLTAIPVFGDGQPAVAIGLAWTALALNMILCYVLGRWLLHPVIEWVIRHRNLKIPELTPQNEWKVVLAVRVSPIPYAPQNYILALGNARWRTYLWMSLLIQGAIGLAIMLVGESVLTGGLGYILLALFGLLVLNLVIDFIRKRLTRESVPDKE
ncbi:MAG: TVP38/TMEM64 family protein [Puniceicoccaceae bacterium]